MGIDVYLRWEDMTDEDKEQQMCGFDITQGKVGYLREAYHGEPYATRFLVKEAFETKSHVAAISGKLLKARLGRTLELVRERAINLYQADELEIAKAQQSYKDFVELALRKEKETGKPCKVYASY